MARFLFVVPPLTGHINPTIAVGKALQAAGHQTAWVGCESVLRNLLLAEFHVIPVDETEIREVYKNWFTKGHSVFGLESFRFFFEEFMIPLAHFMYPSVCEAIDSFQPDLVICDQQALAGSVAARKRKLPFVTLATTSAAVFNPLEQFPKVKEWMTEQFALMQDKYELERWVRPDLSQLGVCIFSLRELIGGEWELPEHYHFVGPSIREEQSPPKLSATFPWGQLRTDKPKIYVSLGTLNAERSVKFYSKVKEAFGEKNMQIILSAPPEMLGALPSNFIVQKSVPQLELLKKVDAVLFHGGHNTFCETLYNGLPMVVAPIKDDQPVIAAQVVQAGVGLRVHFERVKSADLLAMTSRILQEPQFRKAAQAMQKKLHASGGARAAAEILMGLVN